MPKLLMIRRNRRKRRLKSFNRVVSDTNNDTEAKASCDQICFPAIDEPIARVDAKQYTGGCDESTKDPKSQKTKNTELHSCLPEEPSFKNASTCQPNDCRQKHDYTSPRHYISGIPENISPKSASSGQDQFMAFPICAQIPESTSLACRRPVSSEPMDLHRYPVPAIPRVIHNGESLDPHRTDALSQPYPLMIQNNLQQELGLPNYESRRWSILGIRDKSSNSDVNYPNKKQRLFPDHPSPPTTQTLPTAASVYKPFPPVDKPRIMNWNYEMGSKRLCYPEDFREESKFQRTFHSNYFPNQQLVMPICGYPYVAFDDPTATTMDYFNYNGQYRDLPVDFPQRKPDMRTKSKKPDYQDTVKSIELINGGFGIKNPILSPVLLEKDVPLSNPSKIVEHCVCKVCGKTFPQHRLLARHIKSHNEIKRFLCTICAKGFNDKFDLKRHTRTHTGVRPYKCSLCDKAFTQRCSLESHCKKVHASRLEFGYKQRREKLHVCEDCGHTTEDPASHYLHLKHNHPNSAVLKKFYDKRQFKFDKSDDKYMNFIRPEEIRCNDFCFSDS
ncbi:uncharacterized protein LOC126830332 [Patella vulgata]|uniref:uncharacterized protein LOC126830332 n=1 Tax=Patella vulgata TaxID=6465 RepID=UPI0021807C7D|nr:uncharacterized protein LOC126830332 [Patella vulgata]